MKRALGWAFLLLGIGVVCVGVYIALAPVVATYQTALDDPMRDTPAPAGGAANGEEDGKALARTMLKGVVIGAVGVPMTITGTVLLGVSFVQRMRKRFDAQRKARV